MLNMKIQLVTSIIMLIIHIYLIIVFEPVPLLLQITFIVGCMTSILNHALGGTKAKMIDRIMMFFGFFIDLYYIQTLPFKNKILVVSILISSVMFYFIAKLMNMYVIQKDVNMLVSNFYHIVAHITITITHYFLLASLSGNIVQSN